MAGMDGEDGVDGPGGKVEQTINTTIGNLTYRSTGHV